MFLISIHVLGATTFEWNLDGNGSWNTPSNWTPIGGPPNSSFDIALFGPIITGNRTITLTSDLTVSQITFNENSDKRYTLSSSSPSDVLTLDGTGTANAIINVDSNNNINSNHRVNLPISLSSPLTIDNESDSVLTFQSNATIDNNGKSISVTGDGSLLLQGVISGAGSLNKSGTGITTLSANNTFTGDITISGGTLLLGGNNRINDSVQMNLNGGIFDVNGRKETVGELMLMQNSSLNFSTVNGNYSIIHFSSSDVSSWSSGKILTINNWVDNSGNGDELYFGSNINGLGIGYPIFTQILFVNPYGDFENYYGKITSDGRIVPSVPEPGTWGFLVLLGSCLAYKGLKK